MHELLTVEAVVQRYAINATSTRTKRVLEQSNDVIQHEINLQYLLSNLTIKKIAVVCVICLECLVWFFFCVL